MFEFDNFTKYQKTIIEKLTSSQEIVDLLLNRIDSEIPNSDLINDQIHFYDYVPEIDSEAKTYICVDGDIINGGKPQINNTFIYIYVFTHKDLMIDKDKFSGTRVNVLINEIDKLLNRSTEFGLGKLEFITAKRFIPPKDYKGRILEYLVKDINNNTIKT